MTMLSPGEYLGKLYSSLPLYKLLFVEAISVIPPHTAVDVKLWALSSTRSQRDLAHLLSVSASTVAIDLRRLENYGWIQRRRRARERVLGGRKGAKLFLMADHAAEISTGVAGLVGREVLGVARAVQETSGVQPGFTCGPAREWCPDA